VQPTSRILSVAFLAVLPAKIQNLMRLCLPSPRQESKNLIPRVITVIVSGEDLREPNLSMCALFLVTVTFWRLWPGNLSFRVLISKSWIY